jgi:hypothetical protein
LTCGGPVTPDGVEWRVLLVTCCAFRGDTFAVCQVSVARTVRLKALTMVGAAGTVVVTGSSAGVGAAGSVTGWAGRMVGAGLRALRQAGAALVRRGAVVWVCAAGFGWILKDWP